MKGLYIVNQPSGNVRYRMAYRDPLTGKEKRVSICMPCHSVRNQHKAEEILLNKIKKMQGQRKEDVTLTEAVSLYIKDMSFNWRNSTKERNEATLGRVTRVFPDQAILRRITTNKWKEVLTDISAHGDAGTYNEYLKRVKAFLRWCFFNEYLDEQIADKLTRRVEAKDSEAESKATDKYLEPQEAAALLSSMEGMDRWSQITRFMLLSGLRCGEALALNDSDIGDMFIRVNKTLSIRGAHIGPPKTPRSNRDVSITEELGKLINDIREYNEWKKKALDIKTDIFFFSEYAWSKGEYIHYTAFNKYLKEKSEAVLGKPITTHWLRHTHASFLLAAGIPIDVISRRLGHENVEITQRVYLHVIEKLKLKDADMLLNIRLL